MQAASSENPFEGKAVALFLKSAIVYKGKLTAGMFIETRIERWAREGCIIEGGSFIPWSNISAVSPLE